MSDTKQGIYRKFNVSRTDGMDCPGGKHDGCHYFVLDLIHDVHAGPAIAAYANSCQKDYPRLAQELRSLPIPVTKSSINAMFPKPEAIAPLPAEDAEEFYRRLARDTRLDSLVLPRKIIDVLAEAGVHTVADIGKKTEDTGADLTSIKGITEKRREVLIEAISNLTAGWVEAWKRDHPEPDENPAETETPAEEEN